MVNQRMQGQDLITGKIDFKTAESNKLMGYEGA